MVGEGVMHECLHHPQIDEVLIINRRPSGHQHAKLKEIVHPDFFNVGSLALSGYDACFFCLGVSSIGMKEAEFFEKTHTLTLGFASVFAQQNPNAVFCYVSGKGTDGTEQGNVMWARVKGKTENDLTQLFKKAYLFRPGYMQPIKGLKNELKFYKYIDWMYPALRALFPNTVGTLKEIGRAMINVALKGYPTAVLEVRDIRKAAT